MTFAFKYSRHLIGVCALGLVAGCANEQVETVAAQTTTGSASVAQWVDPFIGTENEGNTYPGAVLPWGLASVAPHTINREVDKNAGFYHHNDEHIYSFGHVQMSGVGCPGTGAVPVKAISGDLALTQEATRSRFSNEEAQPGYYKVYLNTFDIWAEMSATLRSGISKYHFPAGESHVLFDMSINQGEQRGGFITKVTERTVEGYQLEGNFCDSGNERKIYFVAELDQPADRFELFDSESSTLKGDAIATGKEDGAVLSFNSSEKRTVELRVGVSLVSIDNARLNLETEQKDLSFADIKTAALNKWEAELSKIKVKGGTEEENTKFYTAFYHALVMPQTMNDVNGEYLAMDGKTVKVAKDFTRYTTFSLWDTYRTVHPLISLTHPKQQEDMIKSMVAVYEESGWLPKWEYFGMETACMVGDPAVPVIVDSYRKGITGFDAEKAYEAMVKSSTTPGLENIIRPGTEAYLKYGYIPMDERGGEPMDFGWFNGIVWGPVSTTLEYNLADFNVSEMAKALGKTEDAEKFAKQSVSYRQLYDQETGFIRPKNKDGSWMTPFDPNNRYWDIKWQHSGGPGYVEGTAWQYLFFVNHDLPHLIETMGEDNFIATLSKTFEGSYFDMTNEPDIQYPFLFNYVKGQEYRTQEMVNYAINKYFDTSVAGIPGNDDAGTLSAWLVFAMMGIYPDVVGEPQYQITTPAFEQVDIELDPAYYPGKTFSLKVNDFAPESIFINKMTLNGKPYNDYQLQHADLVKGGSITFDVSSKPKR